METKNRYNIKILKWLIILIIFLSVCFIAYREWARSTIPNLLENEDPFSKDKMVLVDSLVINDSSNIYTFAFSSGVFGNTNDFVVTANNRGEINKENAFMESPSISSITKLSNDSILIKLIEMDYKLDSSKVKISFKIELESKGNYIKPSKRLSIPLGK